MVRTALHDKHDKKADMGAWVEKKHWHYFIS